MGNLTSGDQNSRAGLGTLFYYTRLANAILIFRAFGKKMRKTPNHEIVVAQKRLREMLDEES